MVVVVVVVVVVVWGAEEGKDEKGEYYIVGEGGLERRAGGWVGGRGIVLEVWGGGGVQWRGSR